MIFGPAGAGKSTLLSILCDQFENLNLRQGTIVLDRIEIKRHVEESRSYWKPVDLDDEIYKLRCIIQKKMESDTAADAELPSPFGLQKSQFSKVEEKMFESFSRKQTDLKWQEQLKTFITCYDSGGQGEFFDIMPTLITASTVNVMVFNLSKDLDAKIQSDYYDKGECWSTPESHYNTVQLMKTALANIQQYSIRNSCLNNVKIPQLIESSLLVVGTHLDQCGDTESARNSKVVKVDKRIREDVLRDSTLNVVTRDGHPGNVASVVHPISNLDINGRAEAAQKIRSAIEGFSVGKEADVPLSWLLFQYEIRLSGKNYITRHECITIAKKCYIKMKDVDHSVGFRENDEEDYEDIDDILMYFHELGIFLYYKEIAKIVFCQPKWLFEILTEIVKLKYKPHHEHEKMENIRKGIFLTKFASDIVDFDPDDILQFEDLLKLFEHLNIMTSLSSGKFFMPALLDPAPPDISKSLKGNFGDKIGDTMIIRYKDGFFPRGVFCCLVAMLARNEGWTVPFSNAYKDHIAIRIGCYKQYLILSDKLNHVTVEIYHNETDVSKSHQVVCFEIHNSLRSICNKIRIDNKFEAGFTCMECQKSIAVVKIQNPCCSNSDFICSKCQCNITTLQFPFSLSCLECADCGVIKMAYNQLLWFIPGAALNSIEVFTCIYCTVACDTQRKGLH